MPIYEFECSNCTKKFEKIFSIKEDSSSSICPVCGKESKKVISKSEFILVGGGWASDGYGNKK